MAPYGLSWDTRTASNGAHTLTATARDAAGNTRTSAPVAVNVANTNFFQNEVLATGFTLPTSIEVPAGRTDARGGAGRDDPGPPAALHCRPDPTPFLQLTNVGSAGVQQGIYDIALDPDFANNHFYYVFYTLGTPNRDRLSRFTANATNTGTVAGSEFVLYQDPQDANAEHHGGAINFGNDGKLYFTTGEHFNAADAQSLNNPRGKVHRINKDGTIPTDDPFYDGAGPHWDSIWAYGLRNPYRAYYDAPTGRLFIGDVGGNDPATSKEEVDVGAAGANYGWPNSEGPCSAPCTSPIYSYPHAGRDAAITAGFVYHGTQFPSSYQGSFFFADYTQNWIRRLTLDANGNVTGVFNFEPADGSVDGPYGDIVYLTEGPDGALYYVDLGYSDVGGTFGVSKIRRIRYAQSNQAPVAIAVGQPAVGADAARRELLERGVGRPRRPTADVLVDVRRRRDLDRREPDPHLHATRSVHRAADRLRRREHDDLDADHDQRRQSADRDDPLTDRRRLLPGGRRDLLQRHRDRSRRRDVAGERVHLEHRLPARRPCASRHPGDRREERHLHHPDDRS